jgi:hypothetical protein
MQRQRNQSTLLGLVLLGLTCGVGHAADLPDLSKVDRRIAKEPAYKSKQPLYGLYVFGPQAKTRVWAVLDKSQSNALTYDVLYFDRNADGDLTGVNERIEGKAENGRMQFDLGSFTDPATGQKHTELVLSYRPQDDGMVMLSMKWCGEVVIRGGYALKPGPYTQFASSPAKAPVLWPGAEGPLSFQFWSMSPLTIGVEEDIRVFLGHRGHGENTFCAVPDTYLPKLVPVAATLIYRNVNGKEKRAQSELRERC